MKTPEHDKLQAIKNESQACGEFIDWLNEKGIVLACWHTHSENCYEGSACICGLYDDQLFSNTTPLKKLLAEFFDIDENKLEEEKLAMLAEITQENRRL